MKNLDEMPKPKDLDRLGERIKEFRYRDFKPCVYFLLHDMEIVYIGQTTHLPTRLQSHQKDKEFNRSFYIEIPESDLLRVESALIKAFAPKLNGKHGERELNETDKEILEEYNLRFLIMKKLIGDKPSVKMGSYGEVQVMLGEHAGKYGYYDDDELELEQECSLCSEARRRDIDLPDGFECDECHYVDYAIVYLHAWSKGYELIPHDHLRWVGEDEPDKLKNIAGTIFKDWSKEHKYMF